MNDAELRAVLDAYPELAAGLPEHADEVIRIAKRIHECRPTSPMVLPVDAPDCERDYWRRRSRDAA